MNIAQITGTGTVLINGAASPLAGSLTGLVANRIAKVYTVIVQGTSGAGTVHVHHTSSGTGTGTIAVIKTNGSVEVVYPLGGVQLSSGFRVVPSGTTGGLVTVVTFE